MGIVCPNDDCFWIELSDSFENKVFFLERETYRRTVWFAMIFVQFQYLEHAGIVH